MKRLMTLATRFPLLALILPLAITLIASLELGKLHIQVSAEGMMLENDSAKRFLEETRSVFGGEEGTLVVVRDPHLLSVAKLEAIKGLVQRIEALPIVSRTASLFNMDQVRSVDGDLISSPYLEPYPETPQQAAELLERTQRHPLFGNTLMSRDGTALAIAIYFDREGQPRGFDRHAVQLLEQELVPLRSELEQVFQFGTPSIRSSITDQIIDDQTRILPAALGLLVVMLAISMGRLSAAMLPMLTAGMSIVWTLALMTMLDIPVGVMTSIVPALLIIIGSTEDIHMLADYREGAAMRLSRRDATQRMIESLRIPLLLTFTTTYLGFLSISVNPTALLREFGLISSTGLLLNFLITMVFVPAWLTRFGAAGHAAEHRESWIQRVSVAVYNLLVPHRFWVLLTALLLAALCVTQATRIRVNNDILGYFPQDSQEVRHATLLNQQFSGSQTFSIIIDARIEDTFLKVRYLEQLEKLQAFIRSTGLFLRSYSYADVIKLANGVMEEDETLLELPYEDDMVREYTLLIPHDAVATYVSADYSMARVEVRHAITSSAELGKALERVQHYLDSEVDEDLSTGITGEAVLNMHAADSMAFGQGVSLAIMVGVIWLIISVLYLNARAGFVALIPNLIPIIVLFGAMGYWNIPLDTSTSMVAAIALGICVDDTMHFMARYHQHRGTGKTAEHALQLTIHDESVPIFTTSIALASGFALLVFSDFTPVTHFGLLSALVVLSALLSTFLLTPLLLSQVELVSIWAMLGLHLQRRLIEECPLFFGMPPWKMKQFILSGRVIELAPGSEVFRQGDKGEQMYVILEGNIEIWRDNREGEYHQIALLRAGDIFGEMAVISRQRRVANASTVDTSRLLVLARSHLERMSRLLPRAAARFNLNLAIVLARRLTTADVESLPSSGVLNRGVFESHLRSALYCAQYFNEPLTRITLELGMDRNHMEEFAPDRNELLNALRSMSRPVDLLSQIKPDRIELLMPRADQAAAEHFRARIEQYLEATHFRDRFPKGISLRIDTLAFEPERPS